MWSDFDSLELSLSVLIDNQYTAGYPLFFKLICTSVDQYVAMVTGHYSCQRINPVLKDLKIKHYFCPQMNWKGRQSFLLLFMFLMLCSVSDSHPHPEPSIRTASRKTLKTGNQNQFTLRHNVEKGHVCESSWLSFLLLELGSRYFRSATQMGANTNTVAAQ